VGFLSRPNLPKIEGMESFQGVSMHTARWPAGLDHAGKRVAVIGSGATGYQLSPELAKTAGQLYLFQRSPSWCFDLPVYLDPSPPQPGWLDRNLPHFRNFMRFRLSWFSAPHKIQRNMHIDPHFDDPHARSARNKKMRDARVAFIESKLKEKRPDLVAKMIPESPPMATRPVMVDRKYSIYDALLLDNVTLVSDAIERITPKGILLKTGEEIELDIIAYATGFKANDFLWPMQVTGKDGRTIEELWAKDGARAYLTAMMPGFPNFFVAYGPNSNNWSGLQVIDFEELTIRFAVGCIAGLIAERKKTVDVSDEAYWRFAEEVDACEARMLYSDPRVTTYYKNSFGRSAANNPIDIRRIWRWTRNPAPSEATGPGVPTADAAIQPRFGADLVVE
jgi:4-hydroxyacetophenone monooxygenase